MSAYGDARKLFKSFHGRDARPGEIVKIKFPSEETALAVGEVYGISYKLKSEKKPYFHRFNKSNRPFLFVSSDGKQTFILKGGYRFTDRGFVG